MAAKARLRLDGADGINRGLTLWLPGTENGGGIVADISPYRRNYATVNAPTRVPTKRDRAIALNGSNQNITGTSAAPSVSALTISAWVMSSGSTGSRQSIFTASVSGTTPPWNGVLFNLTAAGTALELFTDTSIAVVTSNTFAASYGEVVHYAVTFDNTDKVARFYRNGVAIGTPTSTHAMQTGLLQNDWGRYGESAAAPWWLSGTLNNMRTWRRALTPTEIQRLYRDPWAGTARPVRRAVAVPGTQYTLATDALAYEHTVGDAGLGWGRRLDTEALAYEHAVGDAGFVVRRTLQAEALAYGYRVPTVGLSYNPAPVDGDTHDGFVRRSRRQRALDAAERRRREAVAQEAVTLRLSLEAAMGMAAEVVEEAPAEAVEAVQAVARKAARLVPTLADTRADEALLASAREAVAALRAAVDEAARAKALAEDDEDVLMLLRAL